MIVIQSELLNDSSRVRMSTLTALSEVEMLLDLWKCGPSYIVIL